MEQMQRVGARAYLGMGHWGSDAGNWGTIDFILRWDTGGTNSVIWGKINGVYIGMGHSGANTVGRGTVEYTLGRGTGVQMH